MSLFWICVLILFWLCFVVFYSFQIFQILLHVQFGQKNHSKMRIRRRYLERPTYWAHQTYLFMPPLTKKSKEHAELAVMVTVCLISDRKEKQQLPNKNTACFCLRCCHISVIWKSYFLKEIELNSIFNITLWLYFLEYVQRIDINFYSLWLTYFLIVFASWSF